jgi:hypothetical protein
MVDLKLTIIDIMRFIMEIRCRSVTVNREEANSLKRFKRGCICGGYAWRMNGRDPEQPHELWCPQYEEYGEWFAAIDPDKRPWVLPALFV